MLERISKISMWLVITVVVAVLGVCFESVADARTADLVIIGGITPARSKFSTTQMLTILQGLTSQYGIAVHFTPGEHDAPTAVAHHGPMLYTDLMPDVYRIGAAAAIYEEDVLFSAVGYRQTAGPTLSPARFRIDPAEAAAIIADDFRDVLVTHHPASFIMDELSSFQRPLPADVEASVDLMAKVERAVMPRLHIFSSPTRITRTMLDEEHGLIRRWEGLEQRCPTHLWDSDDNSFTELEEIQ